jgi:spore maturation protein B
MGIMSFVSDLIVPMCFVGIILHGYSKKIDIYNSFVEGAKEGMYIIAKIIPTLVGLMVSVGILKESGALDWFSKLISPITNLLNFPKEAVPLTFMRLVSSSASTGLILDIFKKYGPDSFIGRLVSIMMSCTETIFYTISIYFMSVKIKNIRYTLKGALIANLFGVVAALYITKIIFGTT